ncbi:2-methylcitrate dehydratase PrpD [Paenibacillus rhizosphaerae]|uniref:2-methylcitrate dehydratase PrpD n=1 Tax=Paenibacillus rhizosphaerae TaxID=297318 RepID=A0A839TP52_9BACL|nr:MmgE/PrpD family protein [Paenibacillus rhizosphaerae]MBB3128545.1 2-methylcitrate dehydratase PrpD [Paenibacillus rhizosphaerae]
MKVTSENVHTISQRLAKWVESLRYEDLPMEVIERTKLLILDQLGVQLMGSTLPNVQPVRRLADSIKAVPESTISQGSVRTNAATAAYVNGTFGHSCEYDDAHMLAWHSSSAVIPAALALAERENASGKELITAVLTGVQVMCILGTAMGQAMQTVGWHGSKVMGVFGAAAAAGKILKLTPFELAHAFGIAASDAGGTMEYDQSGGEVKRLHAGSASRSGLEAALLARSGFTGPSTIFEGQRGIFKNFGGTEEPQRLEDAWNHWHILDTIFRFFPGVGTVHAPLEAVLHLREENDIDWRGIKKIRIGLDSFAIGHGASITRPTDAISAQFSLGFGIGLQFISGQNSPHDYFDQSRWEDPDILSIIDLIETYAIQIPEGDPALSANVEIIMKDGRGYERYQRGFRGHPVSPATSKDIQDKFYKNLTRVSSAMRATDILDSVMSIERMDRVHRLTGLLSSNPNH